LAVNSLHPNIKLTEESGIMFGEKRERGEPSRSHDLEKVSSLYWVHSTFLHLKNLNAKPWFSNFSGLKDVFEKLRFCDGSGRGLRRIKEQLSVQRQVVCNRKTNQPCYKGVYYMASSASGQDEPNRALWLATRAGKMEPSCPLVTTRCIPHEKFPRKPYNKSFIDQVCSVKVVGYWPRSFFACLWTSTPSRSINTQKKNLANIQPSWPHTWSITHICTTRKNIFVSRFLKSLFFLISYVSDYVWSVHALFSRAPLQY